MRPHDTYIHTYIQLHTYLHTCIHTYIHTCVYIRTYVHTYILTIPVGIRTHVHTHLLAYLPTYIHKQRSERERQTVRARESRTLRRCVECTPNSPGFCVASVPRKGNRIPRHAACPASAGPKWSLLLIASRSKPYFTGIKGSEAAFKF